MLRTNLDLVSPSLGLTHLVVHNASPNLLVLAETLPLFKSLETLFLECSLKETLPLPYPSLHLDALQQLRSVKLDGVSVNAIRLSKHCELHINLTGMLSFLSAYLKH